MIIVTNAELSKVTKILNLERSYLESLKDNITMIKSSDPAVLKDIYDYIQHNGVINGISEHARREISSKHNLFETLIFASNNALELMSFIEDKLSKSKQKIFDTASITYREKGMFDWLNTISFFTNYTSRLVDIILTQPKRLNDYLNKADFEYINKTVNYYRSVLSRLCDSLKDIKRSVDMLSDEQYDPDTTSIIEDIKGKEAVDVGLAPHHFSPVYWARYIGMRWDINTLKSNQEKIDLYAAKLQRLENLKNNNPNPKLDSQIEYWQNEIRILDADIADIEAKYA